PDGWYMSANSFVFGFSLEGSNMCAWERTKLLVGDLTAKVICVVTGSSQFAGLLPSDWDGAMSPPAAAPNYFIGLYSTSQLMMFKMKPNYSNPSATQVIGPSYISIEAFNLPCGDGGDCIPQKDSTQLLASIGERLMYRLAYRNFGTHESLVVNHSVGTNGTVGIRWYEIRSPGATPIVYQQATYAPDSTARWMGSMAMDKAGNIAVGYSTSSTTMYPSIHYTGREAADPPGTLRAEQLLWAGSGSQTPGDSGSNRWGDYSSLETDPVDDCTFWGTWQYLPANGTFNWRTRIAAFKFSSCGAPVLKTDTTTTITADTPDPSVVGQLYTASYTVSPLAGTGIPTGTVVVSDGGGSSCSGSVAAGSCTITPSTAGNRTLTASYGGDAAFNGSTSPGVSHVVNAATTTTSISSITPEPTVTGQSYTVNFTVSVIAPGSGTPTGTMTISDGTGAVCTTTPATGSCVLTSVTAGSKTVTATYSGDANFNGSAANAAHTVSKAGTATTIISDTPDPSTAGATYTVGFTVAVSAPGSGTPTGNVTLSDGTGGSCTVPVSSGSCSIVSTTAGDKTLTATYDGDANFNGSVSPGVPHKVDPAAGSVPAAPGNLTANRVRNTGQVALGWTDNSNNETNFVLERCTITGEGAFRTCTYATLATIGANLTSYNDTAPSGRHRYRVKATNGAGSSPYSNEAQVNIQ
ncbi:MAG TPA: Ig-like domain-containing protein, partial [Bryobacteraceae bacterium]|nr:Ig-like domain-containing protein [Bryobacteraceae bacterium]